MLRLTRPQESLWDQLLPPQVRTLSEELATVDAWLADERFFEPYRRRFHTRIGRPTVPVETYLRLMYLKYRYKLGYESLVREVADSLHWRRFCRIPLEGEVPHSTTLCKLTRKYGPEVLHELNALLVRKARERKVLRGRKLRVDTTVIQAPIEYPTDIGLLADGARVVTRLVRQLQAAGAAARTTFRNRHRTIQHTLRAVGRSCARGRGKRRRLSSTTPRASCTSPARSYAGRLSALRRTHEHQRWFRRQQRWRAGQEATISLGSRKYEWRASRLRGRDGADLWLGLVLVANLGRLVVLGSTTG